jgi:hypothetical protein
MLDDPAMRPRYQQMPDPVDTVDDRDKTRPAAIRLVDYRGDYDTYFEINYLGPYPDDAARDADLARICALPGDDGSAQFFPDRIGSVPADKTVAPAQVAEATTMTGLFAAWEGCSEAEYLGEEYSPTCTSSTPTRKP